jgi:hypothetical protein
MPLSSASREGSFGVRKTLQFRGVQRRYNGFTVGLTALPQLLRQTADATPMYPKAAAQEGHCASIGGP